MSRHNKYLSSVSSDGTLRLFEISNQRPLQQTAIKYKEIRNMEIGNESIAYIQYNSDRVFFIDAFKNKGAETFMRDHSNKVISIGYSPNRRYFASASFDLTLNVYENA